MFHKYGSFLTPTYMQMHLRSKDTKTQTMVQSFYRYKCSCLYVHNSVSHTHIFGIWGVVEIL